MTIDGKFPNRMKANLMQAIDHFTKLYTQNV